MSASEPFRGTPPRDDLPQGVRNLVEIWQQAALVAGDIAHARRTIFLAYVNEGFTETQALELVKTL